MPSGTSIALIVAAVLFVVFLVARLLVAELGLLDRGPRISPEVRKRIRELLATARRDKSGDAWTAAGRAMLDEAQRPARAAAIAWRAHRAGPTSEAPVALLRDAWLAANSPRRLERALWKVLEATRNEPDDAPSRQSARRFLIELYDGALHAPAKAEELRRAQPATRPAPSER